jgi:hypothetical protein
MVEKITYSNIMLLGNAYQLEIDSQLHEMFTYLGKWLLGIFQICPRPPGSPDKNSKNIKKDPTS